MADSAFDDLTRDDAEYVRKRLLAGDTMADIRAVTGLSAKQMRALRDEVFEPLLSDPEEVKKLANGAVLNPLAIIRYRRPSSKFARMARAASRPVQVEMFPA